MNIKFDQHFLENKEILEKEIEICDINNNDEIVEIGPGDCRLTKLILKKKPKQLIAIEKDEKLKDNLDELKNENSNFEFIIGNGLDEIKNIKFNKLISNIPYSITEPIYKFLISRKIPFVVLIHGKKFYKQILDETSKWHYFINSVYDIKLIDEILGNEFLPATKVESVLIKLELKKKLSKKDKFFHFIFDRENRNTKNALIYSLVEIGFTKKKAKDEILKLNLKKEILEKNFENISNKTFNYIILKLDKCF